MKLLLAYSGTSPTCKYLFLCVVHTKEYTVSVQFHCSTEGSGWSVEGVTTEEVDYSTGNIRCSSDHLTSFAVLVDIHRSEEGEVIKLTITAAKMATDIKSLISSSLH